LKKGIPSKSPSHFLPATKTDKSPRTAPMTPTLPIVPLAVGKRGGEKRQREDVSSVSKIPRDNITTIEVEAVRENRSRRLKT